MCETGAVWDKHPFVFICLALAALGHGLVLRPSHKLCVVLFGFIWLGGTPMTVSRFVLEFSIRVFVSHRISLTWLN
jgi:hypothetical protein